MQSGKVTGGIPTPDGSGGAGTDPIQNHAGLPNRFDTLDPVDT